MPMAVLIHMSLLWSNTMLYIKLFWSCFGEFGNV